MGMSTYLKGLRQASDEWKKKRAAVKALMEAGEEVPESLIMYFGEKGIDPKYILEDETRGLEVDVISTKGNDSYRSWIEISVKDIPPGVDRIRFINSW